MNINWNDYIDHVVILSASKNKDRRAILNKEFKRIGLTNYEYFCNIYDNLLSDKLYDTDPNRKCSLHGHYFIIKRAYELGWNSVWIMEDDIRFLNDENHILQCLNEFELMKHQSNIYMFDWIYYRTEIANRTDGLQFETNEFFGGASYWLDRKGMEYFIYMIEHYPIINDTWFIQGLHNYATFKCGYRYYNGDGGPVQILQVEIPAEILPISLNVSSLRLCIQYEDNQVSQYYRPICPQNTIDGSLYNLTDFEE